MISWTLVYYIFNYILAIYAVVVQEYIEENWVIIDIFYGKMSFHRIEEELAFTFPDMIGKCCHEHLKKIDAGDKLSKRDRNVFTGHFESAFTSRFCFSMQRGL